MVTEVITSPVVQPTLGELAKAEADKISSPPNLMGLNTNLANSNKWIGYFPLEDTLGKKYNNLELHLTRFSLPQMEMSSSEVSYRGYTKAIPLKVMNPATKELTLEYLVDENWINYSSLFTWMSGIYGTINPTTDISQVSGINPTDYVPLRIFLLDSYKKKKVQFLFENCWIKFFNDLALETSNPGEITHSFTVCYDNYRIEPI